ncbi:MAG: SGNH/GDSL hydrolase family protein, partial [Candidatus Krumholzibacteriia bacterium]
KLREWQRDTLLAITSTAFAFMAAEAMARLLWQPGGQQPVIRVDPVYGWALRAGTSLHSVDTDRGLDYRIRVNSLGFRDPDRSVEARSDARRVLFIGDSMTFGTGVEVGERCSDQLDARLGPGVEVLNAGVGGWGTDQEFLYLCHEGFDLKPDAVVLGMCLMNDVINNMLSHEFLGAAPKPRFVLQDGQLVLEPSAARPQPSSGRKLQRLLKRSRLLHYIGRHVRMLQARFHPRPSPSTAVPYYPEDLESDTSHWTVFGVPYSPRFENAFRVTEALIETAWDSCRARGIPFILFAFPQKVEVDARARMEELQHHGFDPEWFDLRAPYERLQRLSERRGFPFVYPLVEFQEMHAQQPLFFEHDAHPNAAGHALAAACLEDAVRRGLAGDAVLQAGRAR